MLSRIGFFTTTLSAGLILALFVSTTSANRLGASNHRFRIAWVSLSLSNTGGSVNLRCPVTMEGSFHSATIAKIRGALIGSVSRSTTIPGACTGGRVTILQERLPWHVRYNAFRGTLPSISGVVIDMVGAAWQAEAAGVGCTTRTTAARPARGILELGAGGGVTQLRTDETAPIPLEGEFLCAFAGEGIFGGSGRVTVLGATTTISITLI